MFRKAPLEAPTVLRQSQCVELSDSLPSLTGDGVIPKGLDGASKDSII